MKLGNVKTPGYTFRRNKSVLPLLIIFAVAALVLFGLWQLVSALTHSAVGTASASANPSIATVNVADLAASPTAGSATPVVNTQVMDAERGQPVADVVVRVGNTVVTRSDPTGHVTLYKAVPSDISTVSLDAPGYRSATISAADLNAGAPIKLEPYTASGVIMDIATAKPLANKKVTFGNISTQTDSTGGFKLVGVPNGGLLQVTGNGYLPTSLYMIAGADWSAVRLGMTANVVHMTVKDSDGNPVTHGNARVVDANGVTLNGDDGNPIIADFDSKGSFAIGGVPNDGAIHIRAPGFKIQTVAAKDITDGKTITLPKFISKAVYMPGIFATKDWYDDPNNGYTWFLNLAKKTEVNTIVISVKNDDSGKLYYDSQVPLAKQYNLYAPEQMDVAKVIKAAHDQNVYVVARFVVFRDPAIANARPDWAIQDKTTGGQWKDQLGLKWPNELVPDVQQYNLALAKELSNLGFDEVQFDYVRFPTDGKVENASWGTPLDETLRTQTIHNFVATAHDYLKTTDAFLSIDVFGITPWHDDDNNIGQNYSILVNDTDYICPMIYPSHFSPGDDGFANPNAHPNEIITDSSDLAIKKGVNGYAKYRPWLQDFTLHQPVYTATTVRVQIDAAEGAGAWGWTLWNGAGDYSVDALKRR